MPVLAYRYESPAVIAEDDTPPAAGLAALGQPGTPCPPCLARTKAGQRISTLDLCTGSFVLLTGSDGQIWIEAAQTVATTRGLDLTAYRGGLGGDLTDPTATWAATYGLSPAGATLLRPDGFVAWRSLDLVPNPRQTLAAVLDCILGPVPAET